MKLPKNSVSGVALIIVLGFLVIISALAVAFFSSVNTELKASRTFAAGVTTRQLADSSVQLVMGQIAAATNRGIDTTVGNPTSGQGNEAWASQPGLIRVYGTSVGTGSTAGSTADAFYKLYSSNKMVLTGTDLQKYSTADYSSTSDCYSGWDQAPALWTDLNAPVLVRDSAGAVTPRFPIIDPRSYAKMIDPTSPWSDSKWQDDVEGFYYDVNAVHGIVGPTGSVGGDPSQRLPMPVRWIYVLQDGTLTTPDDNGTTTASFKGALPEKQPTAQNPIVGRIAFWADDETCKLNLNTAAGFTKNFNNLNIAYQQNPSAFAGSYWDTPRFYTEFDYGIPDATGNPQPGKTSGGLALCQLLQNEFQRYPGHPATTSLAPVLNNLLTAEQLYAVVPRYSNLNLQLQPSSTVGGTQRIIVDPVNTPGDLDNKELQPKQDRLYASPDEFLFGAHVKSGNFASPNYARVTNNTYAQLPGNPITPDVIDRLRFFVTAQSRAPELNLYGQPRVTCWPVRSEGSNETTGLNVFDNLILFCSTVGATNTAVKPDTQTDLTTTGVYRYIFTRREVESKYVTPAVNHQDFLGGPQYQQIEFNPTYKPDSEFGRNRKLLQNYLIPLLARPIPGLGSTFLSKGYTLPDQQSLLTEIFDYIRLANSQDTVTTISTGKAIQFAPRGYVPPSKPTYFTAGAQGQAKGFGRMSTLCEATLDFYYAGPVMRNPTDDIDPKDPWDSLPKGYAGPANETSWSHWDPNSTGKERYASWVVDPKSKADPKVPTRPLVRAGYMRAFLLLSTFDPMQGYAPKTDPAATDPKLTVECRWPAPWTVQISQSNVNLGFPATGSSQGVSTTVYRAPASYWGGRNYGGYEGFMHLLNGGPTGTFAYKCKWNPTTYLVAPATANTPIGSPPAGDFGETYNPLSPGQPIRNGFVASNIGTPAGSPALQEFYPFQTLTSVRIPGPGEIQYPKDPLNPAQDTFAFNGGDLTVLLYYGGSAQNNNPAGKAQQTIHLHFPPIPVLPFPKGPPQTYLGEIVANGPVIIPNPDVTTWETMPASNANFGADPIANNQAVSTSNGGLIGMRHFYWNTSGTFFANQALGGWVNARRPKPGGVYTYQTSLQASWALATRIAWCTTPDTTISTPPRDGGGASWNPYTNSGKSPIPPGYFADRWRCIVQPGDTVRSLLCWDGNRAGTPGTLHGAGPISSGDLRLIELSADVPATSFAPHPDYAGAQSRACVLRGGDGTSYFPVGDIASLGSDATGGSPAPVLANSPNPNLEAILGNHIALGTGGQQFPLNRALANLPWGTTPNAAAVNGVNRTDTGGKYPGDFDTGVGDFPDGPFCNKQDEGNVIFRYLDSATQQWIYPIPYFTATWSYQKPGNTFTSPSRQMPSPGMFGSLPSQAASGANWQTLCFSPVPAGDAHPGNKDPKDHYILDLFQMPVVEPYPISEPFSTAGKVNLNYRIAPFDYIRRSTALRGALYPLRVTVVDSQAKQGASSSTNYFTYKTGQRNANMSSKIDPSTGNPMPITTNFRKELDRDKTIQGFDGLYDAGIGKPDIGFFKSASQICERYLYPKDFTSGYPGVADEVTKLRAYWDNNGDLTGDNEREKPYVDLYPRITTKSNTFTVHMRVQTLRQAPRGPGGDYTTWIEGKDNVLGEYRGSSTIERYIDPADPRFSNSNPKPINPDNQSVEPLYHFRTVINKKFTP